MANSAISEKFPLQSTDCSHLEQMLEEQCMQALSTKSKEFKKLKGLILKYDTPLLTTILLKITRRIYREQKSSRILDIIVGIVSKILKLHNKCPRPEHDQVSEQLKSSLDCIRRLLYALTYYIRKHGEIIKIAIQRIYNALSYTWVSLVKLDLLPCHYVARLYAVLVSYLPPGEFKGHMQQLLSGGIRAAKCFCSTILAIQEFASAYMVLYQPYFCRTLLRLLQERIVIRSVALALSRFELNQAYIESLYWQEDNRSNCIQSLRVTLSGMRESLAALLILVKLQLIDAQETYIRLKEFSVKTMFLEILMLIDVRQLICSERIDLLKRILISREGLDSKDFRKEKLVLDVVSRFLRDIPFSETIQLYIKYPGILGEAYSGIFYESKNGYGLNDILQQRQKINARTLKFKEQENVINNNDVILISSVQSSLKICGILYDVALRFIAEKNVHIISHLRWMSQILDSAQVCMLANHCAGMLYTNCDHIYYMAVRELIDWVDNKLSLSVTLVSTLESIRINGTPEETLDAQLISGCWDIMRLLYYDYFNQQYEMFNLGVWYLEIKDEIVLLHVLPFLLQFDIRSLSIEPGELLLLCQCLVSLLKTTNRRISILIRTLIIKIIPIIQAHELLNILSLKESNKQSRRNICRLVAEVCHSHGCVVSSFLMAEYTQNDLIVRHSVLRVIALLEVIEYPEMLISILEHALMDSNNSTRVLAIHACKSIMQNTFEIKHVYHLLNLLCYFILDDAGAEAIDQCLKVAVGRCGKPVIIRYLILGIYHPSKRVRKRYKQLLSLVKTVD